MSTTPHSAVLGRSFLRIIDAISFYLPTSQSLGIRQLDECAAAPSRRTCPAEMRDTMPLQATTPSRQVNRHLRVSRANQ
jgi:hypothetical protein